MYPKPLEPKTPIHSRIVDNNFARLTTILSPSYGSADQLYGLTVRILRDREETFAEYGFSTETAEALANNILEICREIREVMSKKE